MSNNKIIKTLNKENIKITRNEFYNILEDYLKQNKKINISCKNFILNGNKIYIEKKLYNKFQIDDIYLKNAYYKIKKKRYLIEICKIFMNIQSLIKTKIFVEP